MKLVSRSRWGAEPSRYPLEALNSTEGVKIHYEGTRVPKTLARARNHHKCAGRVRAIQASHLANRSEDYSDIAYNFVVCPHGSVYEGRGLHMRPGANGSHQLNTRHYAVMAILGSSGLTKPTPAMLDGLLEAIEHLRRSGGAGDDVAGHRDGYPTACPGDRLYRWINEGARRHGGAPARSRTPPRYQVTLNGLAYGYGAYGDHVTAVGRALQRRGFGSHYRIGPGPRWHDEDTRNYADYQASLGLYGGDADGVPGLWSLSRLFDGEPPG
ncbi:peptidoglycan-binding protein [Streptomyces sp. TR02-1]|uniref:peptidoglycan-binding protein n=1 Tax=Streptomyces sp. TR02-1 TaxID=3385977 RepID=UPI0039A2696D